MQLEFCIHEPSIRTLKTFLEDVGYRHAAAQLHGNRAEPFLPFQFVQRRLEACSPFHRLLLSLLWQGHRVDDSYLRAAFQAGAIDALAKIGLLVRCGDGWQTPGVALLVDDGMLLVTPLPASYPTAVPGITSVRSHAVTILRQSLPSRLHGAKVLMVGLGDGSLAISCLVRGAESVTALEAGDQARKLGTLNSALNGVPVEVLEFVESADLRANELPAYDLVLVCPPYEEAVATGSGRFLDKHLGVIADTLAPHGRAFMASRFPGDQWSLEGQSRLERIAAEHKFLVRLFVGEKRFREGSASGDRYDYSAVIEFTGGRETHGVELVPLYNAPATDPLVTLVANLAG